jgi:hypothetical protein
MNGWDGLNIWTKEQQQRLMRALAQQRHERLAQQECQEYKTGIKLTKLGWDHGTVTIKSVFKELLNGRKEGE